MRQLHEIHISVFVDEVLSAHLSSHHPGCLSVLECQGQSRVGASETIWLAKLNIFTPWLLTENIFHAPGCSGQCWAQSKLGTDVPVMSNWFLQKSHAIFFAFKEKHLSDSTDSSWRPAISPQSLNFLPESPTVGHLGCSQLLRLSCCEQPPSQGGYVSL